MEIGVLDIQGSVEEHMAALERLEEELRVQKKRFLKNKGKIANLALGKPKSWMVPSFGETNESGGSNIQPVLVKAVEQLKQVSGLIIPGGESTTIGKLLRRFGLREEIIRLSKSGKLAVWGTCAGAILLAKKIIGKQQADSLNLMDIVVERNAYGRQLESFETQLEFDLGSVGRVYGGVGIPGVFIRAPRIASIGRGVKILAEHKGEVVAVRQKNLLATNFHPEMTDSLAVHKYFVGMCGEKYEAILAA